ncbi:hypothetical protein [Streptomyces sp. NPDC051211]|uniref:hypothetical protein n=1 Tax=Streptomyces sp. NPDC051211 TaxID=3154643 RepID=UPI00344D0B52
MTLPLTKVAWDHPPTVTGYANLVFRRTVWLIGTAASGLIAGTIMSFGKVMAALLASLYVVMLVVAILPVVAIAFFRRHRVAEVLQAYPWREFPCRYPARAAGSPTTVVITVEAGFSPTFRVIPFPVPLAETQNPHPGRIWFAGDPRFGGVVSPVGGHYPVRVVPHAPPGREWGAPEDDLLARRVGLVRRSGKGTQT